MSSKSVNGILLHERQLKICECYYFNMKQGEPPPTFEEITEKLGFYNTSIVSYHVVKLVKKGLLSRFHDGRNYRNYELTDLGVKCVGGTPLNSGIPVLGTTAAGKPYFIFGEPDERIHLEYEMEDEDIFALHVRGSSMIGDHINDGDYVFVRRQSTCDNGDIIVASRIQTMVEQGLEGFGYATLKRFILTDEGVNLQASNPDVDDIIVKGDEWENEWRIEGKVIAVFRRLHH